jgi:predicted nuclease of predicted toxin-antitoxin system
VRFLIDESVDVRIARHLIRRGHDPTTISANYSTGTTDREVLSLAVSERRVLITNDSDFGKLVFSELHTHAGVILLRLGPYADLHTKISRLDAALERLEDHPNAFIVVTKSRVRVRR